MRFVNIFPLFGHNGIFSGEGFTVQHPVNQILGKCYKKQIGDMLRIILLFNRVGDNSLLYIVAAPATSPLPYRLPTLLLK